MDHGAHIQDFRTSIEYGSIENMDHRDMEQDNEGKHIQEIQSRLLSESSRSNLMGTRSRPSTADCQPPTVHSGHKDDILDIDGLMAAQHAAEAIQVSLLNTDDSWWSNLF